MRSREVRQRSDLTRDAAQLLEEVLHLLRHGIDTGSTDTISRKYLGIREFRSKRCGTGLEAAATEGAERNHLLAAQVHGRQQGTDRIGISTEPNRIAKENHIIISHIDSQRLDLGKNTFRNLLVATSDGFLIGAIRIDRDDLSDVRTGEFLDFLRNGLRRGSLGIIKDQSLGGLGLLAAGHSGEHGCRKIQDSFHIDLFG